MMRKLNQHKSTIVGLFLTGFISVFVCDFLCDIGLIFPKHYNVSEVALSDHHANRESQQEDSGHDHDHGTQSHEHKDTDKDDCCDDMVNSIYASLIKRSAEKAISFSVAFLFVQHPVFELRPLYFYKRFISFQATDLPPPLGGFGIRVRIQSFLN
ncbi:hypothetical protein AWW67_13025 [Roseivirga seohaensis]|jgi:hypothetical protein|uniref:Uncharacterized protein n=1 Tax=Roseivirga seohaensis TaxID=1914963 RepID=A0A150XKN5_9BACT|nr:hypothetical protein [Roseivirga seohaensis]KYG79294.1 hypothetical protein AWW67_13025 [Roseivirga seohaensis]|tara:strand:- start:2976 stop:3440 length:465 start_codon:yes stop_codon:yes gene_type:complete